MKRDPKPVAARPRRAAPLPKAAADIDRVIEIACDEICEGEWGEEFYWWWPRAAWVDPNQILFDSNDGHVFRRPFTTDDEQNVTWADAVEVLETWKDIAPAAKADVLVTASQSAPARVFTSREDSPARPPKMASEQGVPDADNNVGMDPELIRAALGLAADATEEEVTAAAEARKAELAAAETEETTETTETTEETPAEETTTEESPAASQLPEGMVAVPADKWAEVQSGAATATQLGEKAEETHRDNTIAAACASGKIRPADRESMVNLHASDKDSFDRLLTEPVAKGGLAPGLVPVSARGNSKPEAAAATAEVDEGEMAALFGPAYAGVDKP